MKARINLADFLRKETAALHWEARAAVSSLWVAVDCGTNRDRETRYAIRPWQLLGTNGPLLMGQCTP
jgi:hypothetical protein